MLPRVKKFIRWLFFLYTKYLPDALVEKKYTQAGAIFGAAVSYIYMGECIGFKRFLRKWARWEAEYSRRGYRTLSIDSFINYGGYCEPLEGLMVKRHTNEQIILHAELYKKEYLGKVKPVISLKRGMDGETQAGTYSLPSTKNYHG